MSDLAHGYRIKTVCEITGVARNTLLAWERRYGFIQPARSSNGYRLYSDLDLSLIREIKSYVDRGWAVSDAISRALVSYSDTSANTAVVEPVGVVGSEDLLNALLAFNRAAAEGVVAQLASVPYETLLADYFSPVLQRIGEGWESGEYSIAQEHFASGFVRERLVSILLRLGNGPIDGAKLVCCTHPEDSHELGLLMFAIRMAMRGWRITWLGARMPEKPLIKFLNEQSPVMVCISVTLTRDEDELVEFIKRVRAAVASSIDVVMGGPGLAGLPEVADVRFLSRAEEW